MQTSSSQKPVYLIETPAALVQCTDALYQHTELALDLEFDSHSYAYGVTLALIQVATPDACYLIDAFAKIDLSGVYAVFEDAAIQKIMHSPGEDLRLLHSLDCFPKNLFDTEIAARLLNYEQTSLAAMLEQKLAYTMSKKQQRSNWLLRPLTEEQKTYAAADVARLHTLKALLTAEAGKNGLIPFILEEQALLSTTIHRKQLKTEFLKGADIRTLSPYDQHVLNGLFTYRDELSQGLNKPAYKVMDESIVRELAVGTLLPDDLADARGLHHSLKSERAIDRLAARLDAIHVEGRKLELSNTQPERVRQTREERAAREAAERDKVEKFAPVQEALAARYGEFAARYMLSNALVNDILRGTVIIGELKQSYRRELIISTAAALGINLSAYTGPSKNG